MKRPQEVFGGRAASYTTSATHADAAVLAKVVALARPEASWRALDVATGTGHTAFALAPRVARVVAVDVTPEMLAEARRVCPATNIDFEPADVHALPYGDGTFDVVTSRRAPHHFRDIAKALAEMRRVLRPGGRLVIDDRSGPEDDGIDDVMNALDVLHDGSHVRQYRPSAWRRMLAAAGFAVEHVEPYTQHRPVAALTKGVAPDDVAKIHALLAENAAGLDLRDVGGVPHSTHWYVMIAATATS